MSILQTKRGIEDFKNGLRMEFFQSALGRIAKDYKDFDLTECFIDGTFASAKKGRRSRENKGGKGIKIMLTGYASGLPVAAHEASVSPHEITLVEETLNTSWTGQNPSWLIGDKAYDSDAHDEKLQHEYGITLIAPNRSNIKSCRKT